MLSVNARIVKRYAEKVCPTGARGDYPNCVCENGSKFNAVHNICPPQSLESLTGSCPSDSSGELIL